jgi:hypothetical protein
VPEIQHHLKKPECCSSQTAKVLDIESSYVPCCFSVGFVHRREIYKNKIDHESEMPDTLLKVSIITRVKVQPHQKQRMANITVHVPVTLKVQPAV